MKEFIESELLKLKQNYQNLPLTIISDFQNEQEKMKDYNGRQLLEMLQNADGAGGYCEWTGMTVEKRHAARPQGAVVNLFGKNYLKVAIGADEADAYNKKPSYFS